MKNILGVMVFLFLAGLPASSQNVADSLRILLTGNSDTSQVGILNELSWELCGADNTAALNYVRQSIKLSKTLNYQKGLAIAYNRIGVVYQNTGAYDSSVLYLKLALEMFKKLDMANNVAGCMNNIGITYLYQSRYDSALLVFYKALDEKERHNDHQGLASVYNNIGIVYANLQNNDKALWYYLKSIEAADHNTSPQAKANTLNNVGLIYQSKQKYDSAAGYFKRSLATCEKTGNKQGIAAALSNLGSLLLDQEKIQEAIGYFHKALAINNQLENRFAIASIYNNLGWLYQKAREYPASIDYYHKALDLSRRIGSKIQEVSSLEGLSKSSELMGDYHASLKYFRKFKEAQDSVLTVESERNIAELREKFEAGQREQVIRQLLAEAALKEYQLQLQKTWLLVSIIGTILIGVFSMIMLVQRNQKQRAFKDLLRKNIENTQIERQNSEVLIHLSEETSPDQEVLQDNEPGSVQEKYKSSALNSFQKEIIRNRIKYAMAVQKLFLQPDLSIEKLAAEIKTNKSYISQVINETENQNFSSFLNDYRIREARLLILDSENKNMTIESIARMVGFNSKSAFNNAFKKFTGLTPSFFIRNAAIRFDNELMEDQES